MNVSVDFCIVQAFPHAAERVELEDERCSVFDHRSYSTDQYLSKTGPGSTVASSRLANLPVS